MRLFHIFVSTKRIFRDRLRHTYNCCRKRMQIATRAKRPILSLGLVFCTIGILWSVNIGGPEVALHQPTPIASNVQLLPVQDAVIWYSPMLPQTALQASDSVQSQSPAIESYLIQGSLLLSLIVLVLSTLLVGRRRIPNEQVSEVRPWSGLREAIGHSGRNCYPFRTR